MQTFQELELSEPLLRAINELGYTAPTPIQAETLPLLLAGDTDFLGLAATGTGKTAAFAIPLLERLEKKKGVQALILCPTRELAIQVAGQIELLGKHTGVRTLAVYGGTGYGDQIAALKRGVEVVIGTPGRVVDHIEKGTLNIGGLKTLVLDEADEMISMGFQDDLEAVLKAAPRDEANIWLFSATMSPEVRGVADNYLRNPQKVQVNRTEMLSGTVEQIYYKTHEYDKPDLLCKVIDAAEDFYGIVFCQTKALVADVNTFLQGKGYRVDCLHGDLDQTARDRVMNAFRERKIQVLIATDVACRGLDVKDVTHVVNYSIPRELDNYVHRIGRTGRSGKKGVAISFVTFSHRDLIWKIEKMTKSKLTEGTPPTAKEIAMKRVANVQKAFEARGPQGRATASISEEFKTLLETLSKEEIAGRFLALMMPDLFVDRAPERMADTRPAAAKEKHARPGRPMPRERKFDRERPAYQKRERDGGYDDRGDQGEERRERPRSFDRERPQAFDKKFKKPFRPNETKLPPWKRKSFGGEQRSEGPAKGAGSAPHSRWKGGHAAPKAAPKFDGPATHGGEARPKRKFTLKKWAKDSQ